MVIIEDMDAGRPVSAQSPLSAAWKNGDAQYKTSLCALEILNVQLRKGTTHDSLPEGCGLNNNLDSPWQWTVPSERIIYVNGSIVLRFASIRCDVDLMFPCRPRGGTGGPKDASSCGVSLSGDAKRSGRIVIVPGVSSDEKVRRIGGHGLKLGSALPT